MILLEYQSINNLLRLICSTSTSTLLNVHGRLQKKEEELRQKEIDKEKTLIRMRQNDAALLKKQQTIQVMEELVKEKEAEVSSNAEMLLTEANDRLKLAIQRKNLQEASLAQRMIEGAKVLIEKEGEKKNELLQLKTKVAKKKSEIINKLIKKP